MVGVGCGAALCAWLLTTTALQTTAALHMSSNQKPLPGTDQKPSSGVDQKPLPSTDQDLPPGADQKLRPSADKTPPSDVDQKPPTSVDQEPPPSAPRCRDPRCKFNGFDLLEIFDNRNYHYDVAGNEVGISHNPLPWTPPALAVYCDGSSVLEYSAMPRYEPAYYVQLVFLWYCPLLITGSLKETLAAFNVTYCEPYDPKKRCELAISYMPPNSPPFTTKHFFGLEHIQIVSLDNRANKAIHPSERGFLAPLKSMQKLMVSYVALHAGELDAAPPTLERLELFFTGLRRLPEAIHSSTNMLEITIQDDIPLDAVSVPPKLQKLSLNSSAVTLRLDSAPALRSLTLYNWVDPLPPVVTACEELHDMKLLAPAMRALPDAWLKKCWRLKELYISEARNLIALPPTMFPLYNGLLSFTIIEGALETLQEMVLHGLVRVQTIQLNNNHIRKLPSNLFSQTRYLNLSIVDLSSNDLDSSVFEVLAPLYPSPRGLTGLMDVNLARNPRIGDVCGNDTGTAGYSPMFNISSLSKLDLSNTGVTRICKDWKESMPELKLLNLTNTKVSELAFEDMQYTLDVRADVMLQGAPVTAVRVTRDNYKKAVFAPPSFTTMHISTQFACDCRMYWARRAMEPPLHALDSIRELSCVGGSLLRGISPEVLVCAAQEECTAARMPAGCDCVTRPDEDPDHDYQLVRARCENSTQYLVPRRIYPFYPLNRPNNQVFYIKQNIATNN